MPEFTLAQVKAAIEPGRPDTFTTAGDDFAATADALNSIVSAVNTEVSTFTGGDEAAWTGPASEAFVEHMTAFVGVVTKLANAVQPYKGALTTAGQALSQAQADLEAHEATVPTDAPTAAVDAVASQILARLATAYTTAIAALSPIPSEDDGDLATDPGAGPMADSPTDVTADVELQPPSLDGPGVLDAGSVLAGLVPVDLGGGPHLALGSIDPSTLLAGFDGVPGPSLLLEVPTVPPGQRVPLGLDTSLTGSGQFAPLGGLSPATHLTTSVPPTTMAPAAAPAPGTAGRPAMPPFMPFGGSSMGGMPGQASRRPMVGALGRPEDDDEPEERRITIVGDEEWDDRAGLTDAIGRDQTARSTGE